MRRLVAATALVVACAGSAADHEELGDRAYTAGAYRDALAEYQIGLKAAPGNAALHAKAAAAALHAEDFTLAAAEYAALAEEDRSRADEAAAGLERVLRAALAVNDPTAVASALTTLRAIAHSRPLGRYARLAALDAADRGSTEEALALLPTAAAAAPDARTADSLLFVYAMTAVRARDCPTAVLVFEGLIRRHHAPEVIEGAREGLGLCALVEGQRALERGQPGVAEDWLRRASAPGAPADVMRGAFLGLGDVRLAQGDVVGAVVAYQQAASGGTPGDTIAQRARDKLNSLGRLEDLAPTP